MGIETSPQDQTKSVKLDTNVPMQTRNKRGGARPGAGGPKGPRAKTKERQAYLASIVRDTVLTEAFENISALDILEIACRRLLEMGRFTEAADVAAKLAPYRHGKQPTVTVVRAEAASIQSVLADMANDAAPPLVARGKALI